ncbi:MAG: hypothetical protein JNL83_02400 [Myxococcales bacterium]|nr:hypothetical protein [Myxococcales bacterium]
MGSPVARSLLLGSALLVACSTSPSLEARADAFVAAWKHAKYDQGPSIESYLAEKVTVHYLRAPDEPRMEPQVFARADAATTLTGTIEGFVIGDRRSCDARCCTFDTHFQHGDMLAAVASICFHDGAVTTVEAIP